MSHKRFYAILTLSVTLLTSGFAQDKPIFGSIAGEVFDRRTKEPIPISFVSLSLDTEQPPKQSALIPALRVPSRAFRWTKKTSRSAAWRCWWGSNCNYTGRPYTPCDAKGNPIKAEFNSARVDLNHQLDIRVARRWALASSVLETYIDIQNVYNRKPVDAPIFNPRTQRTEQMPAMGIVPTIALAIRF